MAWRGVARFLPPRGRYAAMEFLPALVLALWLSFLAATCVGLVQGNAAAKHLVRMKAKWLAALVYLARARDRAWSLREVQDAAEVDLKDPALRTKTVVFIRHGESAWNEVSARTRARQRAKPLH